MPLETATYITDLVQSNPAHSDGLNNADAHLRLIKGTIKATFPNFTDGALQSTQAQLDAAVTAVDTNGVALLAGAVSFFTNTSDGFGNPSAGTVNVVSGGTVSGTFTATAASVPGTFTATGAIAGPGSCPIGAVMIWPAPTLPTGAGTWAWCNGATISRTTYATLYGLLGTTYGAGDGATTFNLPNYQEVTLVGQSTMGGAASPGLLPSIAAAVKGVLNGLFGSDTHTQTVNEMPSHYHSAGIYDPTHTHGVSGGVYGGTSTTNFTPPGYSAPYSPALITIEAAYTGVRVNSANGLDTTYSNGGGAAMNITQPSRAVGYIIRVA